MKLVNYLSLRLSGVFLLILFIWSAVYLYLQMTEIHDGIDEGLNNLKQEFVYEANNSPTFVSDMQKHNPLNIIIENISYEEARDMKETYTDSRIYFVTEEEEEEVRLLTSVFFCEQDQKYYKIKFFTSTVESEDLIKNMLYLIIALWVSLALAMGIVMRKIINKSNKPFYKLLEKLRGFRLDNTKMIDIPVTGIAEYTELNNSVKILLEENINAFTEQKKFIENASHELQTPLTIAIGKLELLLNSDTLSEHQLMDVNSILGSLNRMKRLNSALLLLSKIKNKQFSNNQTIDLIAIFEEVLFDFDDIIRYKEITIETKKNIDVLNIDMNKDLAYIMMNNLIKNAVSHNIRGGEICVIFESTSIIISNTGQPIDKAVDIFERYISASGDIGSSGLGLSIVKSITEIYNLKISYQYTNRHVVRLDLKKD
ncbi:HAMP domain-containing histidine kinase [Dysgonomonas sp. Marseille-P4677]|uniref:sensor histidine kinase n=1 Tax=Dysgonomonas sp. Marseille-P4677 TaxID=2364790 RepID=UPI001913CA9A|nr:HAMP domain-containing sensor histidine kinase [Dysgonomonas sp. Marseille-P4677]MBK5721627.1 HAMP domain-containing histidine kinase [Dysgonomonas sp. Marseille-P4677]